MYLLAFLCPPAAVLVHGGNQDEVWRCLCLTAALWVPGIVYARRFIQRRNAEALRPKLALRRSGVWVR